MVCTYSCSGPVEAAGDTTSLCLARSHTLVPRHIAGQEEAALAEADSLQEARARLRREERLRSGPGRGDLEEGQGHIGRRRDARLGSGAALHVLMGVVGIGVAAVDGLLPLHREVVGRRIPLVGGRPCSHSGLTWLKLL